MTTAREPFDRSRAGFYAPHRLYEDPDLADILLDHDQVAAYYEMLHTSDRLAGAPVSIPRTVPQTWIDRWASAGLIELAPGDRYVFPGVAEAAARRITNAREAGRRRAETAVRGPGGNFLTSDTLAKRPATDQPNGHGNGLGYGVKPRRKRTTTRSSQALAAVPPALPRAEDGETPADPRMEQSQSEREEVAHGVVLSWCEDRVAHRQEIGIVDGHYRCGTCGPRLDFKAQSARLASRRATA